MTDVSLSLKANKTKRQEGNETPRSVLVLKL